MLTQIASKAKREILKMSDQHEKENIKTISYPSILLNKKTPRNKSMWNLNIGRRCDICLEFEKYSPMDLISCDECHALCHWNCYINDNRLGSEEKIFEKKERDWICSRCMNSKIQKKSIQYYRCGICGKYEGILQKVNEANEYYHNRCLRLMSEVFSMEYPIMDFSIQSGNKISVQNLLRKWRTKFICKICKQRDNDTCVIKCTNTKCKTYFHIPCAINNNLIFSLEFQYDYFGFSHENRKLIALPFYCSTHNKNLIDAYRDYTDQLDKLIQDSDGYNVIMADANKKSNECTDYQTYGTTSYDFSESSHCENIYNLDHPEFDFIPSSEREDGMTEDEEDRIIREKERAPSGCIINTQLAGLPEKPIYPNEESLNFNIEDNTFCYDSLSINNSVLENDIDINGRQKDSDFTFLSKLFYDYLEKNMESFSSNEMSQSNDLRVFVLKILSSYKDFDSDLKMAYESILKEEQS